MPPHDDPPSQGQEHAGSDQSGTGPAEPIMMTTTDPAIDDAFEHPSDWKSQPDSTIRVETTQAPETNPLYIGGVRQVVSTDQAPRQRRQDDQGGPSGERGKGGEQGGKNKEGESKRKGSDEEGHGGEAQGKGKRDDQNGSRKSNDDDRDNHGGQPQARNQPSLMKNLLVTAGVAAVCGLLGAMGYSYFFGSDSGKNSSDQSQSKGQSSSRVQTLVAAVRASQSIRIRNRKPCSLPRRTRSIRSISSSSI